MKPFVFDLKPGIPTAEVEALVADMKRVIITCNLRPRRSSCSGEPAHPRRVYLPGGIQATREGKRMTSDAPTPGDDPLPPMGDPPPGPQTPEGDPPPEPQAPQPPGPIDGR